MSGAGSVIFALEEPEIEGVKTNGEERVGSAWDLVSIVDIDDVIDKVLCCVDRQTRRQSVNPSSRSI